MPVAAQDIIRYVPYLFLVSPSTAQEVKLRLDRGLHSIDAADLVKRCLDAELFTDAPADVLRQAGLVNLVASAADWRFMTGAEIDAFLARDALEEAGATAPEETGTEMDEPEDGIEGDGEGWGDAA